MSGLSEFFDSARSGCTVHRAALRAERLPECCRAGLTECGLFIKHLDSDGGEIALPLLKCAVCGRYFALRGEKYIPVENPLQFEIISRK